MSDAPGGLIREVFSKDYEVVSDQRYRRVLQVAWPVQTLLRLFLRHFAEPWLNGKVTGRGVKVSERQLRHLHRLNERAAKVLGVPPPDLFVQQSVKVETVLLGTGERNTLVLTSTLLDSVDDRELFFLLGREMGHIRSEHSLYLTLMRWIRDSLGSTVRRLAFPAMLLLYRWQRSATLSADRAGLLVSQDLKAACGALICVTLGNRELFEQVDVEEFARNGMADLLAHPVRTLPELFEAEPFIPRRIAGLYEFGVSETFRELVGFCH